MTEADIAAIVIELGEASVEVINSQEEHLALIDTDRRSVTAESLDKLQGVLRKIAGT